MKSIKITTVKIYGTKLRKYDGFCEKKKNHYRICLNLSNHNSHEEFLATLIHELTHICIDLISNKKLTFLISKNTEEPKVVRISKTKLDKIEEKICQETEKEFLRIFKKYRSKL
jgi:Zn-dependent peptidase ImmA (M78 family)